MTIYSIVNNLIHGSSDVNDRNPIWTLVSASGILQGGNPFFVPDFARRFEAMTALAVRIGKLGKGIAPRFAYRYVEAIAPCVIFLATDLLMTLRANGLPWSPAISYDKCLAIGKFSAIPVEEIRNVGVSLTLQTAGSETKSEWTSKNALPVLEDTISGLSHDNTLKTGDLILLGLHPTGLEVKPDMRATLSLNGDVSLRFNIR